MPIKVEARLLQKCLCSSAHGKAALQGPLVRHAPLHGQLCSCCVAAAQGPQVQNVVLQRCWKHGQHFLAQPLQQAQGPDVCCSADRISIDGPVSIFALTAGGRQAGCPQELPAWGAASQNLVCAMQTGVQCKLRTSSEPRCVKGKVPSHGEHQRW